MVGLNNQWKHKQSGERTSTLQIKNTVCEWFHQAFNFEFQTKWSIYFRHLLYLPTNPLIPQKTFQNEPLLKTACLQIVVSVEKWKHYEQKCTKKGHLLKDANDNSCTWYEIREENMPFQSITDGVAIEMLNKTILSTSRQLLKRLIQVGNCYELNYPYTSFAHEMRGEMLVQLEKYNQYDEDRNFTTRNHRWRVLGWSIKQSKELRDIEQLVVPSDIVENMETNTTSLIDQKEKKQEGLPLETMQQFENFFLCCVAPLQERTQYLYSQSLELFYQYLSLHYGQSFRWSLLNKESFIHFLSVWYLDHSRVTPVSAKVFLNTLKTFFRWAHSENISDVYIKAFREVYTVLIRMLPITVEVRKWLKENNTINMSTPNALTSQIHLYQVDFSSSDPVILVKDQWQPLKLKAFPPIWSGHRFLIKGHIVKENNQFVFIHIENVYPVVSIDEAMVGEQKSD